ncbi:type IV pilin protein [Aeromonas encheleia]|uniref:type IV pilin protein n=1 Tax=Aeromonas encheleia TaxID=73010 RepID=UPI001F55B2CD|nr:type IV pilin protein [Aeromonas encheleia]UNP88032.1 type IV pilin protein [Aeromonas encheleia]
MRVKQSGITLLELMVVVAIVAILAAVAYPSFTDGLRKSRRAEAFKGLLSMQLKQEEYRITSGAYSTNVADLGSPSSDYYDFAVSAANQTTYSLKATAKGAQSGDANCAMLGIDKGDYKYPSNDCWK